MANEAKHTSGPWELGYGSCGITGPTASPLVWWDGTNAKYEIVRVGSEVVAIVARDSELTDREIANARLIAAAPELLSALRRMLDAFYEDPMDADHSGAAEAAYAVIARATGASK